MAKELEIQTEENLKPKEVEVLRSTIQLFTKYGDCVLTINKVYDFSVHEREKQNILIANKEDRSKETVYFPKNNVLRIKTESETK